MKKILFMLSIIGVLLFSLTFVQKSAATTEVCFCHNVDNNPHTICTSNPGRINGHQGHVDNGKDTLGACALPSITPTPTPGDPQHFTCRENACVVVQGAGNDECQVAEEVSEDCIEVSPTVTPTVTLAPTQTPSNPGGPGDGRSDGLGCGSHDCSNQTSSSQGQVLGASTGPAVLGLSTTSSGNNLPLQFAQLLGSLLFSISGFVFFKKNA